MNYKDIIDYLNEYGYTPDRTPFKALQYEKFKYDVLKKYNSINDYILYDKLGVGTITIDSRGKYICKYDKNEPFEPLFLRNEFSFPINKNGVDYWVLWTIVPYPDVYIERMVLNKFGNCEYTYLRNPPKRRSVPGVAHYHIFINKCQSDK